jgi:PAS domain S-box-containing protein
MIKRATKKLKFPIRSSISSQKINVLLLDKNQKDANQIKTILQENTNIEFNIEHKKNIEPAISAINQNKPNIILLSLSLPETQSLDTFLYFSSQAPDIPIIVLGNEDNGLLGIKALRNGAQDFLVKSELTSSLLSRVLCYAIERKKAEAKLLSSEQRWRSLAHHISDSILTIDKKGNILGINQQSSKKQTKNIIGKNILEKIVPEHQQVIKNSLSRIFRTKKPATCEIQWLENKGKTKTWLETHVVPIKKNNKVTAATVISRHK